MNQTRSLIITLLALLLLACSDTESEQSECIDPADLYSEIEDPFTLSVLNDTTTVLWTTEYANNTEFLKKVDSVRFGSVEEVIQILNSLYSYENPPILEFVSQSLCTLKVKLRNSERVTEQMGSSGAYSWMATRTFTLTALSDVLFVGYDMPTGSHGGGGVRSRLDYRDVIREP